MQGLVQPNNHRWSALCLTQPSSLPHIVPPTRLDIRAIFVYLLAFTRMKKLKHYVHACVSRPCLPLGLLVILCAPLSRVLASSYLSAAASLALHNNAWVNGRPCDGYNLKKKEGPGKNGGANMGMHSPG